MWHKWWNGSKWSGWEDLGGVIDGPPAAVSWGPNRIDCFARGTNNHMWHKWYAGSAGWSGWEDLGGVISSGPAAASWAPNRIDTFVRGTDNHMWHKWWNGTAWHGWEDLGGIIDGTPAAVSWGPNRIDCFARGMNSAMWHRWWALAPTVRLHSQDPDRPDLGHDRHDAGVDAPGLQRERLPGAARLDREPQPAAAQRPRRRRVRAGRTTTEQNTLFANRNNVGANDVASTSCARPCPRSTAAPRIPPGRPSVAVTSVASQWTLGHEVGHVLGLAHVSNNDRLMTGNGTWNVTNPPPDLVASGADDDERQPSHAGHLRRSTCP